MTTDPRVRPAGRFLGKRAPRVDPRTLRLARYLAPDALPPAPPAVDWGAGVDAWGMLANDAVGDCTVAAAGHLIELWTRAAGGAAAVVIDADVLAAYSAVTGYDPSKPESDTGAAELDVLNYWRTVGIAGHKIAAFAAIERHAGGANDAAFLAHVRFAIQAFGGAYLGAAMPACSQAQHEWSVPLYRPAPPALGGGLFTVVTWGERQDVTANWLLTYVDEAYAVLSPDWIDGTRGAPSGFDLAALQADLAALRT